MQSNIRINFLAGFWLVSLLVIPSYYQALGQFVSNDNIDYFRELDPDPQLYELMKDGPRQQPVLPIEISQPDIQLGIDKLRALESSQALDPDFHNLIWLVQQLTDEIKKPKGVEREGTQNDHSPQPLHISEPINDPAEAMQTLGEPAMANNQSLLLDLVDQYFDALVRSGQLQIGSSDQSQAEERRQANSAHQEHEAEEESSGTTSASRYGTGEYIDHPLALVGHQYVQGGAGEGRQLLGPDGDFENKQVIKSDRAVPSYCNPPNPCPKGFTAADGCLEEFVNSASFSREYQIKQKCSCDNEHSLFDCDSPIDALRPGSAGSSEPPSAKDVDNDIELESHHDLYQQPDGPNQKIDTLARTIQNRFGNMASIRNLIADYQRQSSDHHEVSRRVDF